MEIKTVSNLALIVDRGPEISRAADPGQTKTLWRIARKPGVEITQRVRPAVWGPSAEHLELEAMGYSVSYEPVSPGISPLRRPW